MLADPAGATEDEGNTEADVEAVLFVDDVVVFILRSLARRAARSLSPLEISPPGPEVAPAVARSREAVNELKLPRIFALIIERLADGLRIMFSGTRESGFGDKFGSPD